MQLNEAFRHKRSPTLTRVTVVIIIPTQYDRSHNEHGKERQEIGTLREPGIVLSSQAELFQ